MAPETAYEAWMRREGAPVHRGFGFADVRDLALGAWPRTGGRGAFIELRGMEGLTGMYVAEVPAGGALQPERHLYEEIVYVLEGRGATEVWTDDGGAGRHVFEWQAGSLFALPLNAWHRLYNGGPRPAVFLAVTTAPLVIDLFRDPSFVFGDEHRFPDRFASEADYFERLNKFQHTKGTVWETNFIADVRDLAPDPAEKKGAGVNITFFEMASNCIVGHLAEWPVGRYHKGHHHVGGAILLILRSEGYTLLWPQQAGVRPFESGHGDQVVRVDWREGSVLSPPTGWFHQHFNTGTLPARQLALRFGSVKYPPGFYNAHVGEGVFVSVRDGGTLVEYGDEDPRIREDYCEEIARRGVEFRMPPCAYGA
jgi:quercetin dioxygenase-like cupin family protein